MNIQHNRFERTILSTVIEDDGSGFIYGIVNDAFPNTLIKLGKTIDFEKRLAAYQTYSLKTWRRLLNVVSLDDLRRIFLWCKICPAS